MSYQNLAEKAIHGTDLSREECYSVLHTPQNKLLDLLHAAFRVRESYFGRKVRLHRLINAKSGFCSEDCAYCSQSSVSDASIEKYRLLDKEKILEGARAAKSAKAVRYCIVGSGRSPTKQELEILCGIIRRIKEEVGISICLSLGFLTDPIAKTLKEAGADRYNHNLNASERFYPEICTTHSYEDRIMTLRSAKKAGLGVCSGAIFGMGESEDDIVDLAFSFKRVEADSIPINFFHPIPGTPLKDVNYLTPLKCLTILCLIRFLNPEREIRLAGGREFHLRSLQPLVLYPANSIFVSGYLTTSGQNPEEAWQMIEDMGFEVENEVVGDAIIDS